MQNYPWDASNPISANYNPIKQYPVRVIDERNMNDILEFRDGQYVLIGHTLQWCNDLENTLNEATSLAEKYYTRLVELGDIKPQKTTEELLSDAMNAIKYLSDKVEKLESKESNAKIPETKQTPIQKMIGKSPQQIEATEVIDDGHIEQSNVGSSNRINKKSIAENSATNK